MSECHFMLTRSGMLAVGLGEQGDVVGAGAPALDPDAC